MHTIKTVIHAYYTDNENMDNNTDEFPFPKEFITQLINMSNTFWFYKLFYKYFIMVADEQSQQLLDRIDELLMGSASQEYVSKKLLHILPLWLFCLTKLSDNETRLIMNDFISLIVNSNKTQAIVSGSSVETSV